MCLNTNRSELVNTISWLFISVFLVYWSCCFYNNMIQGAIHRMSINVYSRSTLNWWYVYWGKNSLPSRKFLHLQNLTLSDRDIGFVQLGHAGNDLDHHENSNCVYTFILHCYVWYLEIFYTMISLRTQQEVLYSIDFIFLSIC